MINKKNKQQLSATVTGATGFMGARMVAFLKEKGHFVTAIGREKKETKYRRRWYMKADKLIEVDLRDRKKTRKALKNSDMVFHFAADMGGVGYFSDANYYPFINNMTIDLNVISACESEGVKRMYYASSACAYPVNVQAKEGKTPQLHEDMLVPADSDQMYGWEKLMITLLSNHTPFELRVGIMNTIFGEGQEGVGTRAKFPPTIVHKVLEAKKKKVPIEIWGNGKQTRTFLYIEDALEKMYEVMMSEKYHGPVNIASDEIVTVQQCADWLSKFAGITPTYVYLLDKPSGVLARGIDNSKFYKHYKKRNKFSTRQGFERLFTFMEKHGSS